MATESFQNIEIEGIVIPTQWDRRGQIIQVAIQNDGFEKYLVDEEHTSGLIDKIDKKIRLHGYIIGEDVRGQKIIKITDLLNVQKRKEEIKNE